MINFLLSRPIAVTMTYIAILILGLVASSLLPVSLMPDVDIPKITIHVNDENASARELENTVVKSLRQSLVQVGNLSDITSEARSGSATIQLEFDYSTNIDFAFIEVNEKLDRVMAHMPNDFERPRVIKASATDIPVFYLNLTLKQSNSQTSKQPYLQAVQHSNNQSFPQLSTFADQVIRKRIEQLPTISLADISGRVFSEIVITPDREKLTSTGITTYEIETALKNNNIDLGNLLIQDGQYQYNIRVGNRLLNTNDIANVYIKKAGRIYQLKDLADVAIQQQTRRGLVTSDGKPAIVFAVIKQSNARMKDLKTELNTLIHHFENDYPDVEFTITRNQTRLLDHSLASLKQSLVIGALLAFVIMFFFLKDFKSPILIGISIPVSVVIALLFFYLAGLSLNIVSLSGLILGVGMMIDNAIIVIDNIHQYRERGLPIKKACTRGTNEVFRPLLSSVLTTCAVFIPLIFIGNIAGAIFFDQAIAVTIGLFVSLIVSTTLLPVYYNILYSRWPNVSSKNIFSRFNRVSYEKWYDKGLSFTLRNQVWIWIVVFFMLFSTLVLFQSLEKEKFPPLTQYETLLWVDWNEQINVDENSRRINMLNQQVNHFIKQTTGLVGEQQFILDKNVPNASTEALLYIEANSPTALDSAKNHLKQFIIDQYPGAVQQFVDVSNIFELLFSDDEATIEARLRPMQEFSENYHFALGSLIKTLTDSLTGKEVNPVSWDKMVVLTIDPELLTLYNLTYDAVFAALKQAFHENTVFRITGNQEYIPVVIGENLNSLAEIIQDIQIMNPNGEQVFLSTLLNQVPARTMKLINAGREGEYYPVKFDIPSDEVEGLMAKIKLLVNDDENFETGFAGSYFSNRELIKSLTVILLISLLLLYFILASQFESVLLPLIVLLEVPIDIFGAFLFLKLFGGSINLMSMIGIIVMSGIIINDSILKIDTINRLRLEGYSTLRAIYIGGQRRLKPILMTSLTTILALVPFFFTSGMGSDLQRPLALSVIGGMMVGTLVSLYFIPLCYYYLDKLRMKKRMIN